MAFPHPQSRKDQYRDEDKPSSWGVVWNLFKRTINISDYRNAHDDVNPAIDCTFGGIFHDGCDHFRFMPFPPPEAANWASQYRTVGRTPRAIDARRRTS